MKISEHAWIRLLHADFCDHGVREERRYGHRCGLAVSRVFSLGILICVRFVLLRALCVCLLLFICWLLSIALNAQVSFPDECRVHMFCWHACSFSGLISPQGVKIKMLKKNETGFEILVEPALCPTNHEWHGVGCFSLCLTVLFPLLLPFLLSSIVLFLFRVFPFILFLMVFAFLFLSPPLIRPRGRGHPIGQGGRSARRTLDSELLASVGRF